jgi:hypothetical protein
LGSYQDLTVDLLDTTSRLAATANAYLTVFARYPAGTEIDHAEFWNEVDADPVATLSYYHDARKALRNIGYSITATFGMHATYRLDADPSETGGYAQVVTARHYSEAVTAARFLSGQVVADPAYIPAYRAFEDASYALGRGLGKTMAEVAADLVTLTP